MLRLTPRNFRFPPLPQRSRRLFHGFKHRQESSGPSLYYASSIAILAVTLASLIAIEHNSEAPYLSVFQRVRCDSPHDSSSQNRSPVVIERGWFRREETGSDVKSYTTIGSTETKRGSPGQQKPPPQSHVSSNDDNEGGRGGNKQDSQSSTWGGISTTVAAATQTVSTIGDTVVDLIIPDWAKILPGFISKLKNELSLAPGSLAEEIWYEANDPEINPEIIWEAKVRVSNDICNEEKNFLKQRRAFTRRSLAKYLDIPVEEIHSDDIPIIAMCGSGGGLRALVAGSSSYLSTKQAGLFDCITYTAGVSGSCWLQSLYYSSITNQNHDKLISHLKKRLGVHIAFPPAALDLVSSAPTNKYLLAGLVEKVLGIPSADFGIVDIYGLLLAARLLVPRGELSVDYRDLKLSNQRRYIDNGLNPLPIYTAVRHEIPLEEVMERGKAGAQAEAKREAWFQWFEFTPYEFWCEELEAGIPTWAIGRQFENGKTVWRENGLAQPELRIPLFLGIWGSAFCATLSHYYREIRPFMKNIAGFSGIDQLISQKDEELIKYHPIDPATIPNFALGMKNELPATCPESIFKADNLQLMDAGMSNNLPIYPLLRPGRDIDILIAFDASADCRTDNWLKVADGYARQRGIKGWPLGAGWPSQGESDEQVVHDLEAAESSTEEEATKKVAEAAREDEKSSNPSKVSNPVKHPKVSKDLGYCNIWVGTTEERTTNKEPPSSKLIEEDWELMKSDAGIAVIYFPFLANPRVKGVDPAASDFMSTWNFVYTSKQIDSVVSLARANFEEGEERTKRTVRAVYERKKKKRLEREDQEKKFKKLWKLRMGRTGKKLGQGDHADHFT